MVNYKIKKRRRNVVNDFIWYLLRFIYLYVFVWNFIFWYIKRIIKFIDYWISVFKFDNVIIYINNQRLR